METTEFLSGVISPLSKTTCIEGSLTLPQTLPDIGSVLTVLGTAKTDEAACSPRGVAVTGRAFFQILYLDTEGSARSFDAQCAFSAELEGEIDDMTLSTAAAHIEDIAFKEDTRRVDLRANLVINAAGGCNKTHSAAACGEDIEKRTSTVDVSVLKDISHCPCSVSGSILIPQSMPEVKSVLLATGAAQISSTHRDIERIAVEGEIKLGIVYLGSDKNAPIQYMSESVPFSQIVPLKGEGSAIADCTPARISVQIGNEPDTLEYICDMDISAIMTQKEEVTLLEDAYSTQCCIEPVTSRLTLCEAVGIDPQRRVIRTGATIPESCPEASRVLLTTVTPCIEDAQAARGAVMISGTLFATVCYTTAEAGIRSAKLALPFETEIAAPVSEGMRVSINAQCEYAAAEGSGRELELRACLCFNGIAYSCSEIDMISDLNTSDAPERDGGILLYFADTGETDWDILKKFRLRENQMKDMGEGRRMLMI